MSVWILRLGHRLPRDERVSTHCGLVSRALGADGIIFSGQRDKGLIESVERIVDKWGGNFKVKYEKNWGKLVKNFKNKGYFVVYLTMYGINLPEAIGEIRGKSNLLVIIGSQKVPGDVYDFCDIQVAVGNQPHSEIAALAVFLDRYFQGNEINKKFGGKVRIVPKRKGKEIKTN
ncbi:MAG: tRNA (cytidine(56)-2'-O)-methyltransferase [Candidatus Aenigmarchaeota archaeon]|nr:tRNA (cytidine(56)-2'-O)-methyltransferase [Candidatus Aenigmarchaeota archaeon]